MAKQQYLVLYIENGIKKYEIVQGKYNLKEFCLDLPEETVKDEDIEIYEFDVMGEFSDIDIDFEKEYSKDE